MQYQYHSHTQLPGKMKSDKSYVNLCVFCDGKSKVRVESIIFLFSLPPIRHSRHLLVCSVAQRHKFNIICHPFVIPILYPGIWWIMNLIGVQWMWGKQKKKKTPHSLCTYAKNHRNVSITKEMVYGKLSMVWHIVPVVQNLCVYRIMCIAPSLNLHFVFSIYVILFSVPIATFVLSSDNIVVPGWYGLGRITIYTTWVFFFVK